MATISKYKRDDGSIIYGINYTDLHGNRIRKRISSNLKEVERLKREIEVELEKPRLRIPLQDLSIDEAIRRFLEARKVEKQLRTFYKDRFVFKIFSVWLRDNYPRIQRLDEVSPRVLEDFKVYRLKLKKSPATVKKDLEILNYFYNWSIRMDYTTANPLSKVVKPTPYKKAPRVFTLAELKQIFKRAGDKLDFYEVLYRSGFRLEEACHIQVKDINLDSKPPVICYHNIKAKRDEWHQINARLIPIYTKRTEGKKPNDYIFPDELSTRGTKHNQLRREFKRLLRRLKLLDGTLHDFKSTFVTHLFESGKIRDPRIIQRLAHHKDLETTLGYAREPDMKSMAGAINQLPI